VPQVGRFARNYNRTEQTKRKLLRKRLQRSIHLDSLLLAAWPKKEGFRVETQGRDARYEVHTPSQKSLVRLAHSSSCMLQTRPFALATT